MAQTPEAGLLTRRSSRAGLPSHSEEQWHYCAGRSLLTVAGPCGIFTRFPFHPLLSASKDAGTSEVFTLTHTCAPRAIKYTGSAYATAGGTLNVWERSRRGGNPYGSGDLYEQAGQPPHDSELFAPAVSRMQRLLAASGSVRTVGS